MLRVRHDNLALIVSNHAMTAVVHYGQCLSSVVCIVVDLFLAIQKDLFSFAAGEVCLLKDAVVAIEAVLLDVTAKDLYVLLDFVQVAETFLYGVSVLVLSHEADGRVVKVAEN